MNGHLELVVNIKEEDIIQSVVSLSGDFSQRQKMSEASQQSVDGKGIERILSEFPRKVLQ